MNISADPIVQETLRTPWEVKPRHAIMGLVMSGARRFRSGRESGTFRFWPFGKFDSLTRLSAPLIYNTGDSDSLFRIAAST